MLLPGVNNEQETVSIYRWRKKDIEYLDVSFSEPALAPDLHDMLSLYEYFKLFVTAETEMLYPMAFETNKSSLQRFCEDMRIPYIGEGLGILIGCYFWMGLVKISKQQSFWEEGVSYTGFSSDLSRNWFETLI